MGYTKGKWQVGMEDGREPEYITVMEGGMWKHIACVYHTDLPEGLANAHVLAAASDMLEALEDLEWSDRWCLMPVCHRCGGFKPSPIEDARFPPGHKPDCKLGNALKKARGEGNG